MTDNQRETPRQDPTEREAILSPVRMVLNELRDLGKVRVAVLYGSFAKGNPHTRSDIDLAVYLRAADESEEIDLIDRILMASHKEISLLRLDDDNESPFIVQEALKGIHLVEPDPETLYRVAHRALHESESIRFRRNMGRG